MSADDTYDIAQYMPLEHPLFSETYNTLLYHIQENLTHFIEFYQ